MNRAIFKSYIVQHYFAAKVITLQNTFEESLFLRQNLYIDKENISMFIYYKSSDFLLKKKLVDNFRYADKANPALFKESENGIAANSNQISDLHIFFSLLIDANISLMKTDTRKKQSDSAATIIFHIFIH